MKQNNKIKCVIIIACSVAGSTSNNTDNIASAFSKKINKKGVVLGCRFTLTDFDNEFYVESKNVEKGVDISNPWNIYRNGILINSNMKNRVTMRDIYSFLHSNKYI